MEKTKRIIAAIRLLLIVALALVVAGGTAAFADTSVGGPVVAATTWSAAASPYLVTSDVTVASGALLTVEAGVTVRFQSGTRLIVQSGALKASGTQAAPILLTSWRDTPGGNPAAGDWGGLQFQDASQDASDLLEYLTVSYGSTTTLVSSSPTFNHCHFEHNAGYALSIDLDSFPHGSGNSALHNGTDALRVPAGVMTASGAWDLTSIPYFLEGAVYVGLAPTLSGMTPSNVEQGSSLAAVITGTRLDGAKGVSFSDPALSAVIQPGGTATSLPVLLTVGPAAALGPATLTLSLPAGDVASSTALVVVPPVPRVSALTPNRAFVNRAATLTISGANFSAASQVFLGASALTTVYLSSTQLQAALPPQLIATLGQILVKNPDPRLPAGSFLASNALSLSVELPPFAFSPATLTLRQGQSDATMSLTIPFPAPAGGVSANLTNSLPTALTVPASVTIPEGASAVALQLSAPDTATNHDVTLQIDANQNNWTGNQASVTIRPEPTVNLSPVTLLSGQGFSFFLVVNLSDPAPAGGLLINLAAAPANVVSIPASISVPEGATQAQLTVTNTGTGSVVISGTPAPGKGFSAGDSCSVTVKPIQTTSVTPLVSPAVGINLTTTGTPVSTTTSYAPLVSRPVGIGYGTVISGLAPSGAPYGSQNLLVRVNGSGFTPGSSVTLSPAASGATLTGDPVVVASDGSYLEFRMNIAPDAAPGGRMVSVTSGGKAVPALSSDAARFLVTYPAPELWSLPVNSAAVGSTLTLQLSGRYFQGASEIGIEPNQGIFIGTPVSVSADGTSASVPIYLTPGALPGPRSVRISTPGGNTSAALQTGNVFTVLSSPGTSYTPLLSRQVGVALAAPAGPGSQVVSYDSLATRSVGVSLGALITGVAPVSGAIGSTELRLRVTGSGLAGVDSFSILPNTGLTVTRPDPPVAADGSWAEALVTIAPDAPLTERMVLLKSGALNVPAASAGANRFAVTLPVPEMTSIFPNRREVGSSFTLTVYGRLLTGATAISFTPSAGITESAITVSADGTSASVTVSIAPDAATGVRTVTITTPGGTTSLAPGVNIFQVTALAGTDYNPILSRAVGVSIASAPPATDHQVGYGPILSGAVGVSLPTAPPTASRTVDYGPVASRPVGVSFGTAVTGMTPGTVVPGSTGTLTITGVGLNAVTSLAFWPVDGLTLGALNPALDGKSLTVQVTADAAAPRGPRAAVLKSAAGPIPGSPGGSYLLYVGVPPVITSLSPSQQTVGNSFILTVNGRHLDGSTTVRFEPSDGLTVSNPPVVSADGSSATVSVLIDGLAAGSQRVVVIEGPYGSSGNVVGPNNTFTVFKPVLGAAAAPARQFARRAPEHAPAGPAAVGPVAGSGGSAGLSPLISQGDPALPVVRKILECSAIGAAGFDPWQPQRFRGWDAHPARLIQAPLLSVLGWGYRAPPARTC
jgi:hypothetical protein